MSAWEATIGASDEWYTPARVFHALATVFDLDVAAPPGGGPHVPCCRYLTKADDGLTAPWSGCVWMNPPFGGRNGLAPWMEKFFAHGNGIALTPDRTSAPWWQDSAPKADAILFTRGKIQFERPDGSIGKSPGTGTTLWGIGPVGVQAILRAQACGLGSAWARSQG